jgi:hypothetical protein
MKKVLSLFIALLYLATSSGLALQVHYCMDQIAGFTLAQEEQGSCGKCGMEKASGSCCKDELKFVKLEDAHKLLAADFQLHPPVAVINDYTGLFNITSIDLLQVSGPAYAHPPPGTSAKSLNILHCVFRI